ERRRDAFCGKISVCNNLRQYGIPFSLTRDHTVHPLSEEFRRDLATFVAQCRVAAGFGGGGVRAAGGRGHAVTTTPSPQEVLQSCGISVSTLDLSDVFGRSSRISDDDSRVRDKVSEITGYAATAQVPGSALTRMAKLAVVLLDWMDHNDLDATAIQCWSSMQQ